MKLDSVDSPHEWGWLSPNLRKPKISQDAKKLWSNGFGCGNWKAKIHGKLGFARPPSTFCTSLLLSRLHLSEHKELRLLFLLWSIFHSLKRSWNTMWWELLRSYQFFTHLSHAPGIQFCRNFLQGLSNMAMISGNLPGPAYCEDICLEASSSEVLWHVTLQIRRGSSIKLSFKTIRKDSTKINVI